MIRARLMQKESEHWRFPGWRILAFCSLAGCAAVLLTIAIEAALGVFDWRHPPITDLHALWTQWFPVGLVLVPLEEWIFRGIVLRHLERWTGSLIALVVSSALFSYVAHNGDVSAFWTRMAAGMLMGVIYLSTRSLWCSIAAHFWWNFTIQLLITAILLHLR